MLRKLMIRNFAIIEALELELGDGLTVLSGETGAGKSILVGALHLVLGGRASSDAVRTGCDSAEISAIFDPSEETGIRERLQQLGIDVKEPLVLRRQIQREGRSGAWLNDHPVTVATLGQLAEALVDISGQHQHQSLLKEENHLLLLDRSGDLEGVRDRVAKRYEALLNLVKEREKLLQAASKREEQIDFLNFQLAELEQAQIKPGEERELAEERDRARYAEAIQAGLSAAETLLNGERAVASQCSRAERELERIALMLPELGPLLERLRSARLELEDVAASLDGLNRQATVQPGRLDEIEDRLALLGRLMRKHGSTTEAVLEKQEQMRAQVERLSDVDASMKQLDQAVEKAGSQALSLARELSEKRMQAAETLAARIEAELADLGMTRTRFAVSVTPRIEKETDDIETDGQRLGRTGLDEVRFLISPNVGEDLRPLSRIASGGELSRVMLAAKCVLLAKDPVALSVFDEVDAGIGGDIAAMVGRKIRQLSRERQVICITHLPQIAAYGDKHLQVMKSTRKGRTYSQVLALQDQSAREMELGRMMTGSSGGDAAQQAAKELLRRIEQEQDEVSKRSGKTSRRRKIKASA